MLSLVSLWLHFSIVANVLLEAFRRGAPILVGSDGRHGRSLVISSFASYSTVIKVDMGVWC
jgi:hypothetical protein